MFFLSLLNQHLNRQTSKYKCLEQRDIAMPKSKVETAIEDFVVIPLIILIGLYATASVIDAMLHLNNETFKIIFSGVGGVGYFIYYFKRKMSEL